MRYSVMLYWDDETQGWTAEIPVLDGVATCGDTVPVETVPSQLHTIDITDADIASILASSTQIASAQLD